MKRNAWANLYRRNMGSIRWTVQSFTLAKHCYVSFVYTSVPGLVQDDLIVSPPEILYIKQFLQDVQDGKW